jgi:hypothetical protein
MLNSLSKRFQPFLLLPVLAHADLPPAYTNFITMPTPERYSVCFNHSCTTIVTDSLSGTEWDLVSAPLNETVGSARDERRAIAAAIAMFEKIVGRHTDTTADKGRNLAGFGQPGQMDCIDESTNTMTYLRLLEQHGLFRYHEVMDTATRFGLFVGMPHTTAVIRDRESGMRYAVDSWFFDNGQPPYIVRLDDWRSGQNPGP